MELDRKSIELECANTIGFSEAENKDSFMVGVSVCFSKTYEKYQTQIERLKEDLRQRTIMHEACRNDLNTLCSIINKYS